MPLDDNRKAQDGRRIAERYNEMVIELKTGDWIVFDNYKYWICSCLPLGGAMNAEGRDYCKLCGDNRPPLPGEKDADEGGKDTE